MTKKKNVKRVEKVEKKKNNNFIDKFCEFILKLGFKFIQIIITLVIGAFYGAYSVLEFVFDKLYSLTKKLPKMAKIGLFYGVLIFIVILLLNPRTIEKYIGFETIKEHEVVKYVEIDDKTCKMDKYSCMIYIVSQEYGLTHEQSLLTVAISQHETGNYTSQAFNNKNNVGGNFANGQLATFESLEQGINHYINNLKRNYFDLGLDTIEEIQPKYCPIGAENDPTGINKYWVSGVTKFYNLLLEKY
jgi:hypothetical protein